MTFDKPAQKQFFLDLFKQAAFRGEMIEFIWENYQAVKNGTVAASAENHPHGVTHDPS